MIELIQFYNAIHNYIQHSWLMDVVFNVVLLCKKNKGYFKQWQLIMIDQPSVQELN